jgi:hypothetical protein
MWHIINNYRHDLYYLEKENVIFIKVEKENELSIIDVISTESIDIDSLIPKLIQSTEISRVKLYFPPDQINYQYDKLEKENTDLFIKGNIKLPEKSFRFPVTAIT